MKTKIKALTLKGIRGVREKFGLNLDGKSILIYGDNGTGKSSFTDALEWFYYDQIEHLSNEEIGRKKGKDALRNVFIEEKHDSSIEICYTNPKLDCVKIIQGDLTESSSNKSKDYETYLENSQTENLILRYSDLVLFIIASKKEKLDKLQGIIGFSEVGNLRDLLKKTAGRFKRTINAENFNVKKGAQQSTIIQNFGANAYNPDQFFKAANDLIKPLNLSNTIKSFKDIAEILKQIESKDDLKIVEAIAFQTKIIEALTEFQGNTEQLLNDYKSYFEAYTELRKDSEKFSKLKLLGLLNEGVNILRDDVVKDDFCPLCLQEKNKIKLINELNERIQELEELQEEKSKLQEYNENLKASVKTNATTIEGLLKDKKFKEKENEETFKKLEDIRITLNSIAEELKKELLAKESILHSSKITFNKEEIQGMIESAIKKVKELSDSQKQNTKLIIYSKLLQANLAYKEYRKVDKKQDILTKQQITFENLFADFIKRQEEALTVFLETFSKDINDYYTSMNSNEKVEGIKLGSLKDKNGDLIGITIEYRFFDETKTQPRAYLSESHINCLGLSFFLASVKAFNKENHFFILDDVISSFDRGHRARFAKLLIDKFNEYQVIFLTHEKDFFELVSSDVKSKGWNIHQITWTPEKGTGIEKGTVDIKERIKKKFDEKNTDGLGNDIRIYTEKVMKEISMNIEANVTFKYNDINEKRMAPELLDSIQNKIASKSMELKAVADISRIKGMPMFIGNTTSHDNDFQASIEDIEVMWEDIGKLIKLFYCKDCNKFISTKYLDTVRNRIRCGCKDEKLSYDWKK
jgi:DNA repair exonuclease SbcCD ATPase subunit